MKRLFATSLTVSCVSAVLHGGPNEEAIIAAMRLAEQPNYSWSTTVADDARTYDIDGRTVRGGFTRVRMPVVNSVRRKLGRSVTDTQIDFVFRGNVACVIATDEGWRKPNEIPTPATDEETFPTLPGPGGYRPLTGAGVPSGSVIRGSVLSWPSATGKKEPPPAAYSNLQLAICHPHEELAVIVSSHTDFKVEGNIASGTLTELGAQLLLVHDGQDAITPLHASGTFKLWLRGGAVVKYQVHLAGVLTVDGPNGRHDVRVQQSADTVIKDIGTTVVDVPEEARRKLKI